MKILSYIDSGYAPFVRRLNRRAVPEDGVRDVVAGIIAEVSAKGDKALISYTKQFDDADLTTKNLFVSEEEFWWRSEPSHPPRAKRLRPV
jgi:histidinol dehydrogenase